MDQVILLKTLVNFLKLICDKLKRKLEDNYIQTWPEFSTNKPKLLYLKKIKQNNYTRSAYLNINDKDIRKKITKLRLGCSNINDHKFLRLDTTNKCPNCPNKTEDLEHFLLSCPKYTDIRNIMYEHSNLIYPEFSSFCIDKKIISILKMQILGVDFSDERNIIFMNIVSLFISKIFEKRNTN